MFLFGKKKFVFDIIFLSFINLLVLSSLGRLDETRPWTSICGTGLELRSRSKSMGILIETKKCGSISPVAADE